MKLISLNMEMDFHYNVIFPFFKKEAPDVICLQEVLEKDFPKLRENIGLEGIFLPTGYVKAPNLTRYDRVRGLKHGLAIFSKHKITDSGSAFYLGDSKELERSNEEYTRLDIKNKAILWAEINGMRFVTTHFPITKQGTSTPEQLEACDKMFAKLDPLEEFVLCGDMNAARGNATFSKIAERYKDNIPLEYKTSIDQNLHRVKGIMLMVDGLFTTPKYKATNVRLVDGVSDHMAIVGDINI